MGKNFLIFRDTREVCISLGTGILIGIIVLIAGLTADGCRTRSNIRTILESGEEELRAGRLDEAERQFKRADELVHRGNENLFARSQLLAGQIHYRRSAESLTDARAASTALHAAEDCLRRSERYYEKGGSTNRLTDLYLGATLAAMADTEVTHRRGYAEDAMAILKSSIRKVSASTHPEEHARAQNSLGNAALSLAAITKDDPIELFNEATKAYKTAAELVDNEPYYSAAIQNNLGEAYAGWAKEITDPGLRSRRFEDAINAYTAALAYTAELEIPKREQKFEALVLANRADAVISYSLERGDAEALAPLPTDLDRARVLFEENADTYGDSKVKAILGRMDRIRARLVEAQGQEGRRPLLERSVKFLEESAEEVKLSDTQPRWAEFREELGDSYFALAEVADKERNLKEAVKWYKEALYQFTETEYPRQHERLVRKISAIEN